jgi:hypothetical protein
MNMEPVPFALMLPRKRIIGADLNVNSSKESLNNAGSGFVCWSGGAEDVRASVLT